MIVPRMPLEVLPLPGAVVPVGVGVGVGGGELGGGELGGGDVLVDGGGVCLDFEGVAEGRWLPGLEDVPDSPTPGV
jgi:hypothetical protein